MMNYHSKFEIIKKSVDIEDVAIRYGIKLNRTKKAICPIHNEKTASFSINTQKQIFHCFGCGAGGDAITLVSILLKVNMYEAAKIINNDFNCGVDFGTPVDRFSVNKYKNQKNVVKQFDEWIKKAFVVLCDYYKELRDIKKDPQHSRFVEALQSIDKIEYYIDFLMDADENGKLMFWKTNKKVVSEFEQRRTSG